MNRITVIGSINVDLVVNLDRMPKSGETVLGNSFFRVGGGKGANQAITASRLGSVVKFVGKIGNDEFGTFILDEMIKDNIDITSVTISSENQTGIAFIYVDKNAENSIVVVPGSNFELSIADIDNSIDKIENTDVLVMQNEIPNEVIEYSLLKGKEKGKITVLNCAPAKIISKNYIKYIDYLIVNESELDFIYKSIKSEETKELLSEIDKAKLLLENDFRNIIITLGKNGSIFINKNYNVYVPARKVNAIDTTAAGDAFVGSFFSYYDFVENETNIRESLEYATRVSAYVVQKKGAQSSLPYKKDMEEFN